MSVFNGKVKKVKSLSSSADSTTKTIVEIVDDFNNEVYDVKVSYPTKLSPTENPVTCNYVDSQNNVRIFENDDLKFSASVVGKKVTLEISMRDANDNELGTDKVEVTIEEYNS